jgi:serine/threonine protein kinase
MKMALNSAEGHESLTRLLHEAKITANLEHPNIVPVHEISCDNEDNVYFTMKYVQGDDLETVLAKLKNEDPEYIENFPFSRLLEIFKRICDGVAFAHAKGVIHRDLKPENIMVGEFGEVLIMDWGIAKLLHEQTSLDELEATRQGDYLSSSLNSTKGNKETQCGEVFGTPAYMAPEQILGKIDEIDHLTDIFALGGILYNILALRGPVVEKEIAKLFKRVLAGEFKKPTELACSKNNRLPHITHQIPEALSAVAMKALSTKKEDRYKSVKDLQHEISAYESGYATDAQEATRLYKLSLMFNRNVIFSLLIIFILTTAIFSFYKDKKTAEDSKTLQAHYESNLKELKMQNNKTTTAIHSLQRKLDRLMDGVEKMIEEDNLELALNALESVNVLGLSNSRFHYLRGRILEGGGNLDDALAQYKIALEKSPRFTAAATAIQRCQDRIGSD